MIRRITPILALLLAPSLLISTGASGQAQCPVGKIAVVQVRAIYGSIDRYAEKDSTLNTAVEAYKIDVARLNGVIDSTSRSYQEKTIGISASARQLELRKLDGQIAQIQQRKVVLQQQLSKQRDVLLQPIEIGVQSVLDSIRTELKCAAVFDASAGGGIASVNRSLDVTQRVIDRIKTTGDTAIFGPHPVVTSRP
jgi:Skp family chaperone for outer membrane proteins